MANSKYEYVKEFEHHPTLLPNTYLVVRVDGRGFHRLSAKYAWEKPNDRRALDLMNAAAVAVMQEIPDVAIAYGISDEFSFVFDRTSNLFDRRDSKILTTVVSTFTSYYVHLWPLHFPGQALSPPMPSFDGRAVQYPSKQNMRDYMSWRQVDCHINNLYNSTFWALVRKGQMGPAEAEEALKGTSAANKNEIMFSRFAINYNNEPVMFKKGSVLIREYGVRKMGEQPIPSAEGDQGAEPSNIQREKERRSRAKTEIKLEHEDIIGNKFWEARPWLLREH